MPLERDYVLLYGPKEIIEDGVLIRNKLLQPCGCWEMSEHLTPKQILELSDRRDRRRKGLKNALSIIQELRKGDASTLVKRFSGDDEDAVFVEACARRVLAACDDESLATFAVLIIGEAAYQGFIGRPQPVLVSINQEKAK